MLFAHLWLFGLYSPCVIAHALHLLGVHVIHAMACSKYNIMKALLVRNVRCHESMVKMKSTCNFYMCSYMLVT